MKAQALPAGISGKGIEVFRDENGKVFFLQDGLKKPYLELDAKSRCIFISELDSDKKAIKYIEDVFGIRSLESQEEKFVSCRYGNIDYKADLLNGRLTHEAPRCSCILDCAGFNVVCKVPVPINGALSRKEYHIVLLLASGLQTKEISDILGITDNTTRTHIQRIHEKLGVNNNLEVSAWAHKLRII